MTGRAASLPPNGYSTPQTLFLDGDAPVVRVYPERDGALETSTSEGSGSRRS
ncbi:hypothetical protein AHiyo8_pI69980 (plasmid) [Arthrobacter sp. Hiyo8]|nr:hypothetical protein AHiyo8_pI69980 [Arthrobacter sp. Hiyo8]